MKKPATKAKPKLKKKAASDDPFASDEDGDADEAPKKAAKVEKKTPAARQASGTKRSKVDSDEDEEDRPKKKRNGKK